MVQILSYIRRYAVCALLIGAFLLVQTMVPVRAETCGDLVRAKCIRCHFETRICNKLKKKKGKSSWKRTIKSMMRHGTELSRTQQKALITCLAGRDASLDALCK